MSIKIAFEQLLDTLIKISEEHGEMHDTAVREVTRNHMYWGFKSPEEYYELDTKFNMFTDEANQRLHAAFVLFFNHPSIVALRLVDQSDEKLTAICKELNIEPGSPEEDKLYLLGLFDCISFEDL